MFIEIYFIIFIYSGSLDIAQCQVVLSFHLSGRQRDPF